MIIVATADGIEIDGLLLKNNVEIQAYISAHNPVDLSVESVAIPPYDLTTAISSHSPQDLAIDMKPIAPLNLYIYLTSYRGWDFSVYITPHVPTDLFVIGTAIPPYDFRATINSHSPQDLLVRIGPIPPVPLHVHIQPFHWLDFNAHITSHSPSDLLFRIGGHYPEDIRVNVSGHNPNDLFASLAPIPYHKLTAIFWIVHHSYLYINISGHSPYDLNVLLKGRLFKDLKVNTGAHSPKDLMIIVRLVHSAYRNLRVFLFPVKSSHDSFSVSFWGWALHDVRAFIGGASPMDLSATLRSWHIKDIQFAVKPELPKDLNLTFEVMAELGFDLLIMHHILQTRHLLVSFDIWKGVSTLPVTLWGVYFNDLTVTFTMGGHHDFSINLPMTTGYLDLVVIAKPASRIMTTVISILTVEIHDLYVSINQGWPWGFYSTYRDLSVALTPAFFLALYVSLRPIDGSGTDVMGAYINRSNFPSLLNAYPLEFFLPETAGDVDTAISQQLPLRYENQFDDIVEEIIELRLSWPRIRIFSDAVNLTISLYALKQELFQDLQIDLFAYRADVPKMPTSQPLVRSTQYAQATQWPEVFQITEIELWADDPPNLVRKVDVMFGEQVHQYYWVSSEQRAYKKEDYEKWTLMTRGYLPHAEYSGQIDYVTLYEISDMTKYPTIDSAMTAMVNSFKYKDQKNLEVSVRAAGSYLNLNIALGVWGFDRLYNLFIFIEPMHLCDLTIQINCVS